MQVVNESRVDVEYKISPDSPIIRETKVSNRVVTYILSDRINVRKIVDKVDATIYDELYYTICIQNISHMPIHNINIWDGISKDVEFVHNSVYVDSKKLCCVNPGKGIWIGTLQVGGQTQIRFKVVVTNSKFKGMIHNKCIINYDYVVDSTLPPIIRYLKSNTVTTFLENHYFKEISVFADIFLPRGCIGSCIKFRKATAICLESKVVRSRFGCNVVAIGVIMYQFLWFKMGRRTGQSLVYEKGFSCILDALPGVNYINQPCVSCCVSQVNIQQKGKYRVAITTDIKVKL